MVTVLLNVESVPCSYVASWAWFRCLTDGIAFASSCVPSRYGWALCEKFMASSALRHSDESESAA